MKANSKYKNMSPEFWALVKFVSQAKGYTARKTKAIKTYTEEEIVQLLEEHKMFINRQLIKDVADYSRLRAEVLNTTVRENLMNAKDAQQAFEHLHTVHKENKYLCKLPMNKQKKEKRNIAFFTAIINILAEQTIRTETKQDEKGFNDNPKSLTYVLDDKNMLVGASSRVVDGMYPNTNTNPDIVWEIKEYYYTTTFGSRVADGVFETQLDGYELTDISTRTGKQIQHVWFIDGRYTWWDCGRSYLCRIFDILHSGFVDEVIFGKEVLTRWPEILRDVINR